MKKTIFLLAGFSLMLAGCGGSTEEKQTITEENTLPVSDDSTVDFNIPSPSEQFSIIAKLDAVKNTAIMHNPDEADNYTNSAQKALNFGVYTADVAYLTSFNETNKYLTYFGKLEKLGDAIGVSRVFGDELGKMAKKWNGNADSLFKLSDETYNKTFNRLIEIGKGEELSLMLMGGWIESMHLMLGSSKGFGKSPKLEQMIADQKLVAENLSEFLTSYEDNPDVASNKAAVNEILRIFELMDCSTSASKVESANGRLSFSGGESCKMTEKCFNDLKNKISVIRTKIIAN